MKEYLITLELRSSVDELVDRVVCSFSAKDFYFAVATARYMIEHKYFHYRIVSLKEKEEFL